MLDADSLEACATRLQPKTCAAAVLADGLVPYYGVTLLPPMVRRRKEEVTCQVSSCGKTTPLGLMRIHITMHAHTKDLHACVANFVRTPVACFARMS